MRKQINIEGMSCEHCVRHVTNALDELDGISNVSVDLQGKNAVIEVKEDVTDTQISAALDDAGYEVVSITVL
jgi:copper ion binding protein